MSQVFLMDKRLERHSKHQTYMKDLSISLCTFFFKFFT
jgi:hypothetical protein